MKKTLILSLGLALAASFTACDKQQATETNETANDSIVAGVSSPEDHLKIAYFDMARFVLEYKPAVSAMEDLRNEQAKSEREFQSRQSALEAEAAKFEEKMRNNAFLSQSSAEQQYADLQRKSQKLQQDYAKKVQDLTQRSQKLEQQYADTLLNYLKEYNADAKYEMIIDRAAVLLSVDGYDITAEIINNLNARAEQK